MRHRPLFGRAEKRCKQGVAVEVWPAQPVYRAVATDESGGRAIADEGIVLDVQRKIRSYGCPRTQYRRSAWLRLRPARFDRWVSRPPGTIAGHRSWSILRHLWSKLAQNLRNDILHRPTHVHNDGILVGVGLFQDCEVTVEEVWEYGMLFACSQPRGDQRPLAVQIDDAYLSRSSSGCAKCVFAMSNGGWSSSPSCKGQPSRWPSAVAIVVFPLPETPVTMRIALKSAMSAWPAVGMVGSPEFLTGVPEL
jgi:hypothetical protein